MTVTTPTSLAEELRRGFDASFAAAIPLAAPPGELFIEVRAGGEVLAVRALHVAALVKAGRIVPVPSRIPELEGLAAIRGALYPVFALARLLALADTPAQPSFLLLSRSESSLAFAFDEMERVRWGSRIEAETAHPREYLVELVRLGTALRPVIDVPALAAAIRRRAGLNPQGVRA